ncbi:hypothetical protein T484DRAFT_1891159 [Baffinella frigidus]|nr:hypothetical protein T484DRAFT_1891159 [Cryptophyta sp. CCMP2293]
MLEDGEYGTPSTREEEPSFLRDAGTDASLGSRAAWFSGGKRWEGAGDCEGGEGEMPTSPMDPAALPLARSVLRSWSNVAASHAETLHMARAACRRRRGWGNERSMNRTLVSWRRATSARSAALVRGFRAAAFEVLPRRARSRSRVALEALRRACELRKAARLLVVTGGARRTRDEILRSVALWRTRADVTRSARALAVRTRAAGLLRAVRTAFSRLMAAAGAGVPRACQERLAHRRMVGVVGAWRDRAFPWRRPRLEAAVREWAAAAHARTQFIARALGVLPCKTGVREWAAAAHARTQFIAQAHARAQFVARALFVFCAWKASAKSRGP